MLSVGEARRLVSELYRYARIRTDVVGDDPKQARVVFRGGVHGEHSIYLSVSSEERIRAHFEGYCQANGFLAPQSGELVRFPSASNWRAGGYRTGRVLTVGPKNVRVVYLFKSGRAAMRSVPIRDCIFKPSFHYWNDTSILGALQHLNEGR